MPTATTVLAPGTIVEFHNVGALTSAWTPPTDVCSNVPAAVSGLTGPFHDTGLAHPVDNCDGIYGNYVPECTLGAAELDELYELQESPTARLVGYHSPGLQCPDAWETAGVIAMNNGTPSASGVFSPIDFTQAVTETLTFPPGNFMANMLTSVLAPAETAVACCPSGFSIDPYMGCYSHFPATELANKTGCWYLYTGDSALPEPSYYNYTWAYHGTTTVVEEFSMSFPIDWIESDDFSTSTVTLDASGNLPTESANYGDYPPTNAPSYTGIAVREPVWLVHGGDGSEGSGDEGGEDSESESPSAARGLAPSPAWGAIFGVLAAWGVGMVAGVGLLVVW
ncbi:hypothetical protein F5X68DRAFT_198363 [Plectosphaerella plurivora]|uniref:Uncharacterized protein n=1 Tax=Plectosphaerella plurivora TaxID=936078 RepID=A0A9P8VMG7_9PEZI|nr:hypothetical protein F5X68DRAFT_198363 [Plectosphaerella plurivora]